MFAGSLTGWEPLHEQLQQVGSRPHVQQEAAAMKQVRRTSYVMAEGGSLVTGNANGQTEEFLWASRPAAFSTAAQRWARGAAVARSSRPPHCSAALLMALPPPQARRQPAAPRRMLRRGVAGLRTASTGMITLLCLGKEGDCGWGLVILPAWHRRCHHQHHYPQHAACAGGKPPIQLA